MNFEPPMAVGLWPDLFSAVPAPSPTQDPLHALPCTPPSAFKALCLIIFYFNFLFNVCSASFCFSLTSLQPPALPTTFLFSVLRASTFLLRAPPVPSGQVPVPLPAGETCHHPQLESHHQGDLWVPLSLHPTGSSGGPQCCLGNQLIKLINHGLVGSKMQTPLSPKSRQGGDGLVAV